MKEIDLKMIEANRAKINSLLQKDYNYLFRDIIENSNENENIGIVVDSHLDARKKVIDNMNRNQ